MVINPEIGSTSATDLKGEGPKPFKVTPEQTDGISASGESFWDNPNFTNYHGYYKTIPQLAAAIKGFATWVLGKGFEMSGSLLPNIERMNGIGEDNFLHILWNMIVTKKVNGDAYAEIIRDPDEGTLLNLKPLDPASMRTVVNGKGIIVRYEQKSKINENEVKKFRTDQIFHLMNDRFADEIHGTSVIESVQFIIDAHQEAMADKRRVHHNSTIRIIEVDTEDKAKHRSLAKTYAGAIKTGDVLLVPKGNFTFPETPISFLETQEWIRYLEDFFYQTVGVPKVILGGGEFAEGGSKISYLTFEQVYTREITELEADLREQLGIILTFKRPASLQENLQATDEKNSSQVGFQANDTTAGVGQ